MHQRQAGHKQALRAAPGPPSLSSILINMVGDNRRQAMR